MSRRAISLISYFENNNKGQFKDQYLPVVWSVISMFISETSISTQGLTLVQPSLFGRHGQGEVDVSLHVPVVLVLVQQLWNEFGSERDQEGVRYHRELSQHVQDFEPAKHIRYLRLERNFEDYVNILPNSNIFCSFCHSSSSFTNKFLCVQSAKIICQRGK